MVYNRFGVTYEGLKQIFYAFGLSELVSFGVTYEGLKLSLGTMYTAQFSRFGVTYEGLKLDLDWIREFVEEVLELPMRV